MKMEIEEFNSRRFTARNTIFAGIGLASIIVPALILIYILKSDSGDGFGAGLFIGSLLLGPLGAVLNILGLISIREGNAGDCDLILTWPAFLGAGFSCLVSLLVLLVIFGVK